MSQAGGISIHAVDIARGLPAAGLRVELFRLEGARVPVASGTLAADGTLKHPVATGEGVTVGTYEVVFHLGDWLAAHGEPADGAGFLDEVPFRFTLREIDQHYHLPFKFTPWGIQLFRGV